MGKTAKLWLLIEMRQSGTCEAFVKLLMGDTKFSRRAIGQPGSGQVGSIVSNTPDAIGYLSIGYVRNEVKILDKIELTIRNIKNRSYLLVRTLHHLNRGTPKGVVRELIEFALSSKVQRNIVKKTCIPISGLSEKSQ